MHQHYPLQNQNSGVALITVLLVVALATTAAAAMASRQHIDIRRTENILLTGQIYEYQLGIEQWSKQFLNEDRLKNQIDHNNEDWSKRLPPLPVEGGTISGYLEDIQGRFNINNLDPTGQHVQLEMDRFRRLIQNLNADPDININENLTYLIQDWIDAGNDPLPNGAEEDFYQSQELPYRTSNQLLQSLSELLLLNGFSQKDYDALMPRICVLPQVTPINVNTATAEVLSSLVNGLLPSDVQRVIDDRPFNDVQTFISHSVFAGRNLTADGLSVATDYFMLYSEVNLGHFQAHMTHLLERNDKGITKTLARSEENI